MSLPSPRKRSSSKTSQNFHPVAIKASGGPSIEKRNSPLVMEKTSSKESPKLKKYIHVAKLVSPEQPNEYLKVLNIPVYPDTLKIGRQNTPKTSNKITDGFFDSRVLSRNHAELFVRDDSLMIRDLKSSNGTFINDTKLEPYKEYQLHIGDQIDLGTTLESQMAHKKITCIIKEFDFVTLKQFSDLVEEINNKDVMISRKLELFNSTFDALVFGEIVDDVVIDNKEGGLLELISEDNDVGGTISNYNNGNNQSIHNSSKGNNNKDTHLEKNIKYIPGVELRNGSTTEMVRRLVVAVNNEYIQQQRLREMNSFLKNYNNTIAGYENNHIFKIYDKLLRSNVRGSQTVVSEKDRMRLEDQLKKINAELHHARRHLSTAQGKEEEYKKSLANKEELERALATAQERAKQLEMELESVKAANGELEKRVAVLEKQAEKERLENIEMLEKWKQMESEKKGLYTYGCSAGFVGLVAIALYWYVGRHDLM